MRVRYMGHVGTFVIDGAVTGNRYQFAGHGAVVEVADDDAAALLARDIPIASGCCRPPSPTHEVEFREVG